MTIFLFFRKPLDQFSYSVYFNIWPLPFPYFRGFFIYDSIYICLIRVIVFWIFLIFINYENKVDNLSFVVSIYYRLVRLYLTLLDFRSSFVYIFFCSFLIVLFRINLIGLIPLFPCISAQLIANISRSFSIMIGITLIGIIRFGFKTINLFIPSDVPVVIFPLVFILEIISYCTRAFSLALRLFSNRLSGHSLLHILFGLVKTLVNFFEEVVFLIYYLFINIFSFVLLSLIFLFEGLVAFLQAYVWSRLFLVYLKDFFPV